MIALLGFILVLLGIFALIGFIPGGVVGAIVMIVVGAVLIAYDRGALRR